MARMGGTAAPLVGIGGRERQWQIARSQHVVRQDRARAGPPDDRRFSGRHAAGKAATDIAAAREAAWKETVKKAAQNKQALPSHPSDLETGDEPQEPRLTMIDVTHERVAAVLATAAPKGVLMVRDELAGFLLGMNAYNDAARPYWLEAWNGRPYRVDRVKNANPLRVRHNAVAWFGWHPARAPCGSDGAAG
jgi:hypothetical protein